MAIALRRPATRPAPNRRPALRVVEVRRRTTRVVVFTATLIALGLASLSHPHADCLSAGGDRSDRQRYYK